MGLLLTTTAVQLHVRKSFCASGNDTLEVGGGPIVNIEELKSIILQLQPSDSPEQSGEVVCRELGEAQRSTRGSGKGKGRNMVRLK